MSHIRLATYNVNGIRARLNHGHLVQFLKSYPDIDILCIQETKAESSQVKLSTEIKTRFPYRLWKSTHGTTQRKGLSGTCIWSSIEPIRELEQCEFDEEGRICSIEFPDFNLVSVYTPTTGSKPERFTYRTQWWHQHFTQLLQLLNKSEKPSIICGDLNVCHKPQDVYNPIKLRNKIAGFLDIERSQFQEYLSYGYVDAFRQLHPSMPKAFTWWNSRRKIWYEENNGLRLDYFLTSKRGIKLLNCRHLVHVRGSDHCPLLLDFQVEDNIREPLFLHK